MKKERCTTPCGKATGPGQFEELVAEEPKSVILYYWEGMMQYVVCDQYCISACFPYDLAVVRCTARLLS